MNLDIVRKRVAEIREAGDRLGDNEAAHHMEDELWRDVLLAIAEGHPMPILLATEALETRKLTFGRWYS